MKIGNKLMVILWVAAACVPATPKLKAEEQSDWTKTIVRAVEHRLSMVHTLRGRVLLRRVISDRRAEASFNLYSDLAPKWGEDAQEIRPFGKDHVSLSDFEYDLQGRQWWREIVDIRNTGQDPYHTGFTMLRDRDLDPRYLYNLSVCDGEKVYHYIRSTDEGWVYDYHPTLLPDDLAQIRSHVIATLSFTVFYPLKLDGYVAKPTGEGVINGIPCLKYRVYPPAGAPGGSQRVVSRFWIAPALGHAGVREERLSLDLDNNPLDLRIVTADDFVELVPGLWCPRYVRYDRFNYVGSFAGDQGGPGDYTGRDAWISTGVIQWERHGLDVSDIGDLASLDLQANVPLDLAPSVFPFDAHVYHHDSGWSGDTGSRASPSLELRRYMDRFLPDIEPDPLGLEPPADLVQRFLEGN